MIDIPKLKDIPLEWRDAFIPGSDIALAIIKDIMYKQKKAFCKICEKHVSRAKIYEHWSDHFDVCNDIVTEQYVRDLIDVSNNE